MWRISAVLMLGLAAKVFGHEPVKVVASYSILGELVERVGGDAVTVGTLVGRDGEHGEHDVNPHVWHDVRLTSLSPTKRASAAAILSA